MADEDDLTRSFRLGQFTVRPERGEIVVGDEHRHVEPKVMDVLLCLARESGHLVTKQQLIDDVWDGRPVTDEVIARCISALRNHLADDHRSPQFIETLPKRGYRLIAAVEAHREPDAMLRGARRAKLLPLAVAGVVVVIVAAWFLRDGLPTSRTEAIESIAVLPFANMSAEDMQYLADGVTEELTYALARHSGLQVAARTTAFQFRDTALDVREIGSVIDVDAVIEGSVRREGDRLRVTAQLIDARSGYHLWAASLDGSIDDVFSLQRQVAERVRDSVRPKHDSSPPPAASEPESFAAYDLYLQGLYALNRRGLPALTRAIGLFREAIALDPGYGPAYLELANALLLVPSYSGESPEAYYDDALQVVRQGVQADPAIAVAAAAVNGYIANKRGDWLAADRAYRAALGGEQVTSTTHQWYSNMLASVGRLDAALEQARKARRLDPLSPVVVSRLAMTNLWADNDAAAARQFALANELGIRSALHTESQLLLMIREGRLADARLFARGANGGELPGWFDALLDCIDVDRRCDEATAQLDAAGDLPPRVRLISSALLGSTDRVREIAARLRSDIGAFETELLFIRELEAYRRDAAFESLLDDIGISDYWAATGCRWTGAVVACEAR